MGEGDSVTVSSKKFPISEVFGPVAQGEGILMGQRSMFLRFGACDGVDGRGGLCLFCDSMYAADSHNKEQWDYLTVEEIVTKLRELAPYCHFVTITGGNPVLYDLADLVEQLKDNGYTIAVETQATIYKPWLIGCDVVTLSPKPPSSGFTCDLNKLDWVMAQFAFEQLNYNNGGGVQVVFKVVVNPNNDEDYRFASMLAARYFAHKFYMLTLTKPDDTVETLLKRYRQLEKRVMEDTVVGDVHVGMQLHAMVHGADKRGI